MTVATLKKFWKEALILLAVVGGLLSASNVATLGLPKALAAALVVVGLVCVAICRVADASDYRTDGGTDVGKLRSELEATKAALAASYKDLTTVAASAKAQLLTELQAKAATPAPPAPTQETPPNAI